LTGHLERTNADRAFGPRRGIWQRIKDVALIDVAVLARGVDGGSLEALEERLLEADFGVTATLHLVDSVETEARKGKMKSEEAFLSFVGQRVATLLDEGTPDRALARADRPPTVVLLVGVNGVGKTTTLARLAHSVTAGGDTVVMAAGDTFRAGAIEQVGVWGERLGVPVVAGQPGGDPAAVVFDAIEAARRRGIDYVLADTAGRLHTQGDLMEELAKVGRVAGSRHTGAPHEVLLCLDATIGQNGVAQARAFAERLPVTGLVVTKLDGTARGGIVVAISRELGVPVKFVGLGEGADDLAPFDPVRFAGGLFRRS
jgi:fused signal recognition particle receptor